MKRLAHGMLVQIDSLRWGRQRVGTAIGYASANGDSPFEMHARCVARGEKTVWLNAEPAVLSDPPQPFTYALPLTIGEEVQIEGCRYRVALPNPATADNAELVPITPRVLAASPLLDLLQDATSELEKQSPGTTADRMRHYVETGRVLPRED